MSTSNHQNQTNGFFPILISTLIAGAVAGGLHWLVVNELGTTGIYAIAIPVIIAVPVALLGTYGYEKGFGNLKSQDLIKSLAGGIGAAIGVILIIILS